VYVFVAPEQSELARATLTQTFSRKETADWLNENFVCLFVDAEAQPEVAAYVKHYLSTVKQAAGWPAHVWLTPELRPYDGANYLPATEEWGRPGFLKSARAALDLWTNDPAGARTLADEAIALMQLEPVDPATDEAIEALLRRGAAAWLGAVDAVNGGFGTAPKNPEPETIRFLLRRGSEERAVALQAARTLVMSGLHDRGAGGFYRRTLDAEWRQPHRQKTLLDQARITLALFAAAEAGGDADLRDAGVRALEFASIAMRHADGSWAVSRGEPEEGGDPVLRGRAGPAVLGQLAVALAASGESSHGERARVLARDLRAAPADGRMSEGRLATVHDYLAVAAALWAIDDQPASIELRDEAVRRFLDHPSGHFLANAEQTGPGVPLRVPVQAEPFRAEAFALGLGLEARDRAALSGRLWWICEYDPLPAGEILLALARANTAR
jgi:hypothetical protein